MLYGSISEQKTQDKQTRQSILSVAGFEQFEQRNYIATDREGNAAAPGLEKALIFAQNGSWFFAVTQIDTVMGDVRKTVLRTPEGF